MTIVRLFNTVIIFLGIHNMKQTNATYSISNSSFTEMSGNFYNVSDAYSDQLSIQLTVDTKRTSDLKNIIRSELLSTLKDFDKSINCPTADTFEDDSHIVPRSIVYDSLTTRLTKIENILKKIQAENSKIIMGQSIGVHCSSCSKPLKNQTDYPKNCKEVQRNGKNATGIYEIYPSHADGPFPVLCDMEIRGGGWTHIQKRFDGSQDFYLGWRDYKFGFGKLEGEFWLGLQNIFALTGFESVELLVEIVDRSGKSAYAHYSSFGIGPETGAYKLERLSGYTGDAGDSLSFHLGQRFSTKDLDFTEKGCATRYLGGWWYHKCLWSNLNGKYINIDLPSKFNHQGLHWGTYRDVHCQSKSRMLVRPIN